MAIKKLFHKIFKKNNSKALDDSSGRQVARQSEDEASEDEFSREAKIIRNPTIRSHAELILAVALTLVLVAGAFLIVYDFYFLLTYQASSFVTAYFPWTYGVTFSSAGPVLTLFSIGLGLSAFLFSIVIIGLDYFFSRHFSILINTWKNDAALTKSQKKQPKFVRDPYQYHAEAATTAIGQSQQLVLEKREVVPQVKENKTKARRNSVVSSSPYELPAEEHVSVFGHILRFAIIITRVPTNFLADRIPNMREEIQKSNISDSRGDHFHFIFCDD